MKSSDPSAPAGATILLVDDEPNILSALCRVFRRTPHTILTADSGARGLDVLACNPVDVIISDMRMSGMDGVCFLEQAAERWPLTIRMLLSGQSDMTRASAAIESGVVLRYLHKPWASGDLIACVDEAIANQRVSVTV